MVTLSEAPAMATRKALRMKERLWWGPPLTISTLASPGSSCCFGSGVLQQAGRVPVSPCQVSQKSRSSSSTASPSILMATSRHLVCPVPNPE